MRSRRRVVDPSQETQALALIHNLEGYLVHRDNDEIERTERGALWLIMGS